MVTNIRILYEYSNSISEFEYSQFYSRLCNLFVFKQKLFTYIGNLSIKTASILFDVTLVIVLPKFVMFAN